MTPESIRTYQRRIASANKSELIVIIYDIILENLSIAEEASRMGEKEEMQKSLVKTLSFIKELLSSLDMKYEISHSLASIYIYVNRCVNFALLNGKIEEIRTAKKLIEKLQVSFRVLAEEDKSLPVMENTEKLLAGFTYAKNLGLSETTVDERSMNRGYRV